MSGEKKEENDEFFLSSDESYTDDKGGNMECDDNTDYIDNFLSREKAIFEEYKSGFKCDNCEKVGAFISKGKTSFKEKKDKIVVTRMQMKCKGCGSSPQLHNMLLSHRLEQENMELSQLLKKVVSSQTGKKTSREGILGTPRDAKYTNYEEKSPVEDHESNAVPPSPSSYSWGDMEEDDVEVEGANMELNRKRGREYRTPGAERTTKSRKAMSECEEEGANDSIKEELRKIKEMMYFVLEENRQLKKQVAALESKVRHQVKEQHMKPNKKGIPEEREGNKKHKDDAKADDKVDAKEECEENENKRSYANVAAAGVRAKVLRFAQMRPPPPEYKRLYIKWKPSRKEAEKGRREQVQLVYVLLEVCGVRRVVRELSFIGKRIVELYVPVNEFGLVVNNFKDKNIEFAESLDRNYIQDAELKSDGEIQTLKNKMARRVGFLLARNTNINLRKCIVEDYEQEIIEDAKVVESEFRMKFKSRGSKEPDL